jgi:hypothetical protein
VAIFFPWGVLALGPVGFWYLNRMYVRMRSGDSRIMAPFRPVIDAHNAQASEES